MNPSSSRHGGTSPRQARLPLLPASFTLSLFLP